VTAESGPGAVGRSAFSTAATGTAASLNLASQIAGPGGAAIFVTGTALSAASGIARGAYLATNPKARYLDQIAVNSLPSRSESYWSGSPLKGFEDSSIFWQVDIAVFA
jgi:hypothetical protein